MEKCHQIADNDDLHNTFYKKLYGSLYCEIIGNVHFYSQLLIIKRSFVKSYDDSKMHNNELQILSHHREIEPIKLLIISKFFALSLTSQHSGMGFMKK